MATTNARSVPAPVDPFVVRYADPGPLGLAAFAMTTFVLSTFNAGLVGAGAEGVVLGLALFYGGLVQLLAGMWEFVQGNTFGAVAFASFGGFWMSFWYLVAKTDLSAAKASDVNHGIGVYLLGWTIFTLYMFVASTRTTTAIMAVFGVLTLTFLFLAIGKLGDSSGMTKIGGWLGLLTAFLAWYASFAAVTNSAFRRVVLPVLPR